MKIRTFKANMATEIQYSQTPLKGRLWIRIDTMPVPIVTLNQLLFGERSANHNENCTYITKLSGKSGIWF